MPRGARSDWHLPALIIGTAVMAFFLGSTTTLWLATAPLTGVARGTNALNEKPMSGDMSASASSPAGPAKASTVQETTSGSAQPAETAAVSTAPFPPTAAASAAQSAASQASPPSPAISPPQGGDFSLQVGAFLDAARAKSLADQLAARGDSPALIDAADGYGRTWHYVRLGAFADERAAALAASDLLARVGIGAAVVRVATANAGH
jgi:cell division septation protein DedD